MTFRDTPDSKPFGVEPQTLQQLLVESVRDYAIVALDRDGSVLTWNLGAERITGYRSDEIVGRHFSALYPPDKVAERLPQHALEVAARTGRYVDEGWRLRSDSARFWASVVITALRDERGAPIGFATVTRDLTEQRRHDEALRRSEERFRLLVQEVKDYGIFMLDREGHVASWNDGARQIKQYAAHEIIGRHFSAFYPPEDLAWGKPAWELEIATAEGRFEDEGWRLRKDGTRFWANVVITALRDDRGELIGFGKVTRDLTERRAAHEQALADMRRVTEAEAANRAKTEFLTTLSHELRTPLNAIGGYAELLSLGLGGALTGDQQQFLERIRRSQQHLLGIINDLLNFGRIDAGQVTYEVTEVELASLAAGVVPLVAPQARAKGIGVELTPAAAPAVARADRAKVEQILLNLLSNAVKFTDAGGRVRVGVEAGRGEERGRVRLTVSDTGTGIPSEKLEAIFEPFVQLGRSLTTSHEGTGLGLAISRDLARAMGGDLVAASTPGEGSTFTLTLPSA
jgi:PAS domain S-box-containing protein